MRLCGYNPAINYAPVQHCINTIAEYGRDQASERKGMPRMTNAAEPHQHFTRHQWPPVAEENTITMYEQLPEEIRMLLVLAQIKLFWHMKDREWHITGVTHGKGFSVQFPDNEPAESWSRFIGHVMQYGHAPHLPLENLS